MCNERTDGRELNRSHGGVTGKSNEPCPSVVAFLGPHRADEGYVLHLLGELRQVFADPDAFCGSLDLLEGPAVVVPWLEIPQVDRCWPTVQPQQNHGLVPLRVFGDIGGEGLHPPGLRCTHRSDSRQTEPISARRAG